MLFTLMEFQASYMCLWLHDHRHDCKIRITRDESDNGALRCWWPYIVD